jgi:SAM-dependent methyltransferase
MDLLEAKELGFDRAVRHPWELARLELVRKLIARHVTLSPGDAVLDIGCGDTFVVEQLAADYPSVRFYAVDTALTDGLIAYYRARLNAPNVFVSSSLDTISPPIDHQVSLVLLMDVIEHVPNDESFLSEMLARPEIGAGTHLLVTVPSFQALFCSHDRLLGHYRRYSSRGLRRLVEGAGLQVLTAGYLFFTLLPLRIVEVLKERLLSRGGAGKSGLVTWNGSAAATRFLKNVLVADFRIASLLPRLGIPVPGLSNYAICKKSA